MFNKYEKCINEYASKLDLLTNSDGEIIKQSMLLIDSGDDESIRKIMYRLSSITNDADSYNRDVLRVARELKDAIIIYVGYKNVKNICNSTDEKFDLEDNRTLDELLIELNSLVGLKKVKQQVYDLIAYQKVQMLREKEGLHSHKNTLHLAFIGNPGTGKTTVARIVGRIYKKIGLLSSGHFIEVSRTDLIAGYQGQTALKVKKVIDKAKGGVLFIDEAYSITENEHSDSYGRECLTELTKALEDYREDLVVIVAGYTEPMKKFFESNPGLKSRFNTFIEFDNYNVDELMDIIEKMCTSNDYKLSDGANKKVRSIIEQELEKNECDFANGRFVRNIYEDAILNHARRINEIRNPSREDLMNIIDSDICVGTLV